MDRFVSFLHHIEYLCIRSLVWIINLFPIAVSTWLARRIGGALYYLLAKRRKVALENLNIALGDSISITEKKKIVLGIFRHLPASLVHFFNVSQYVKESSKRFVVHGEEHLHRAFARGRGAILIMSHLGHWEFLAFVPHLLKYPCTVMGKTIRNPYINTWVQSLRKTVSVETCTEKGGARAMFTALKKNELVAITIDQWAGNDGLWINFFGQPASTTNIPARLAEKTGCAMVPAFCIHKGNGNYEIRIKPEMFLDKTGNNSVESTTQELNHLLEREILKNPDQWLWTHKRWKAKKDYNVGQIRLSKP